MNPTLTVLMAVRNGAPYVRTAIESVLGQTVQNFRFLIVDDASTDNTRRIVSSYRDSRIELLPLERHVGQTTALNLGVRQVSTSWIARMDADDFSASDRLEEQTRALEENPAVRCIGTRAWEFHEDPRKMEAMVFRPERRQEIWRAALRGCGIIHGSVLINRDALLQVGGYNERYRYASDRDLFIRFLTRYPAMNIPKPLLGARRHPNQDSFSLAAAGEYVDVYLSFLSNGGFSVEDRAILRESLAYSYLFRAACRRRLGQHEQQWKDLVRAVQSSPKACARYAAGNVGRSILPSALLSRLKEGTLRNSV